MFQFNPVLPYNRPCAILVRTRQTVYKRYVRLMHYDYMRVELQVWITKTLHVNDDYTNSEFRKQRDCWKPKLQKMAPNQHEVIDVMGSTKQTLGMTYNRTRATCCCSSLDNLVLEAFY